MKPFFGRLLLLGAFSCLTLLGAGTARAATYTVDTTADNASLSACTSATNDCSLRGALVKANSDAAADTVVLQDGGGVSISYSLSNGVLPITTPVTIQGNNATIVAGGASRALAMTGSGSSTAPAVTLNYLTVSGGKTTGDLGTGAAIDAKGVALALTRCTFRNNTASVTGGAVAVASLFAPVLAGTLTATDCTFSNNTGLNGSALSVVGTTATLNRCTFSGNTANGSHGGAIYVTGTSGSLGASNATIANNTASGAPSSGVVGGFGGAVQLTNCTLSGNSGTAGNYALAEVSTAPTFSALNSILAVPSGSSFASTLLTAFTSNGHNLFTDTPTQKVASDLVGKTNASLFSGALASNGGLVQTLALATTSPAFEAGDDAVFPTTLATDARGTGFPRKRGTHVDIGAFETRVNSAPVPATTSASLATWSGRSLINRPDRASDADGDTLTWSKTTSPSHGTLTVDSSDGLFLYVPTGGYTGSDSFTLTVSDGVASANVSYTVTVGAAPVSGTRIYTAVGASDANGYGASDYVPTLTAAHGYTALLESKFKASEGTGGGQWVLSNRGVNGFTAPDLVRTVGGQSVLSLAMGDGAAAYTLWIGPNDVLHLAALVTPSEAASDFNTAFSQVVTALKNTGTPLVVCNVPQLGSLPAFSAQTPANRAAITTTAQTLNTGIASACSNASVPVVDLYNDANSTAAANISSDGFHPNDTGYQLLADKVWPFLTARVSLRPYVAGLTPTSSTTARGASQTFAIHVKDTNGLGASGLFNGSSAISEVWFTANKTLSWDDGACFVYFPSAANPTQGTLYGRKNGAFTQSAIGTGGTLVEGDGASVNAAQVSVTLDSDGSGLTVTLPITAGLMPLTNTVWVRVQDAQSQVDPAAPTGLFGNIASGSWTVTAPSNSAPVLSSVVPASGTTWSLDASGYTQARSVTLSGTDADGANDIDSLWLLVGTSRSWAGTGTFLYVPRSHALWLRNDAGDAWLGPVSVGTTGAVLENSSVRVDASGASETRTANGVALTVSLQLKSGVGSQPKIWGYISDQKGLVDTRGDELGFVLLGNWIVDSSNAGNSAPVVAGITPNASSTGGTQWTVGGEREAVVDVSDANGAKDIESAWLLAGTKLDWDENATLIYVPSVGDPTKGMLYLRDSAQGTFLSAAITGSQSSTLSNGHVSVRLSGVTIETTVDGHLKVHLPLTFAADMAKNFTVWGRAQDRQGATDAAGANSLGFVAKTTWNVAASGAGASAGTSAGTS